MISILCPTRGRPDSVRRLIESAKTTASDPGGLEFIFYVDEDDPARPALLDIIAGQTRPGPMLDAVVGPRILLSECWNVCQRAASGEILMQCGDDIVFQSELWDSLVRETFQAIPDRIGLVYGRDGIQDRQVATHGFLHRNWVQAVGYFVPSLFASDYNDMWLTKVAEGVDRLIYLPEIYTEHMHPVANKGPWDRTHQERMDRHNRENCDRIWSESGDLRQADILKLKAFIGGYAAGRANRE